MNLKGGGGMGMGLVEEIFSRVFERGDYLLWKLVVVWGWRRMF